MGHLQEVLEIEHSLGYRAGVELDWLDSSIVLILAYSYSIGVDITARSTRPLLHTCQVASARADERPVVQTANGEDEQLGVGVADWAS